MENECGQTVGNKPTSRYKLRTYRPTRFMDSGSSRRVDRAQFPHFSEAFEAFETSRKGDTASDTLAVSFSI